MAFVQVRGLHRVAVPGRIRRELEARQLHPLQKLHKFRAGDRFVRAKALRVVTVKEPVAVEVCDGAGLFRARFDVGEVQRVFFRLVVRREQVESPDGGLGPGHRTAAERLKLLRSAGNGVGLQLREAVGVCHGQVFPEKVAVQLLSDRGTVFVVLGFDRDAAYRAHLNIYALCAGRHGLERGDVLPVELLGAEKLAPRHLDQGGEHGVELVRIGHDQADREAVSALVEEIHALLYCDLRRELLGDGEGQSQLGACEGIGLLLRPGDRSSRFRRRLYRLRRRRTACAQQQKRQDEQKCFFHSVPPISCR